MRKVNKVIILLITLSLTGCVNPSPIPTTHSLLPRHFMPGPILNIYSPNSEGWQLSHSNTGAVVFTRLDPSSGNTYVAQINSFHLPAFASPEELLAIIKSGAEKESPSSRFQSIEANFQITTERPYPCIRFRGSSIDLKAKALHGNAPMTLTVRSIYCQHPTKLDLGVLISFSQRGGTPDPDFESQANAFIEGVQVPAPK
jgi:hypothetical protein